MGTITLILITLVVAIVLISLNGIIAVTFVKFSSFESIDIIAKTFWDVTVTISVGTVIVLFGIVVRWWLKC